MRGETTKCTLTCLRISVKDASTNTTSRHHFAVESEIEDASVKEMLLKLYESEFSDLSSEKRTLSQEDNKFMSIMRNNVQLLNGHYELPLPFSVQDVKMPNNRKQVLQRTESVKRRLLKDPQFYKDYVEFMDRLLEKGYARKSEHQPSSSSDLTTWYIPHHGVYIPNKPGKI